MGSRRNTGGLFRVVKRMIWIPPVAPCDSTFTRQRHLRRRLVLVGRLDLTSLPFPSAFILGMGPEAILARANRVEDIETDALWFSREGRRISACNVNHRVRKLTLTYLGRDLCPHLIRDCAATSIATKAPKDVGITRILGHATLRMSEQHYNQANMVSALQRLHSIVLADWTEAPSDTKPS